MDGPSVNWNVLDIVSEKRNENELEQLLVIGRCSQYVLHGVFKNGVTFTKCDLGKILKSMFDLFHDSPARRDINMRKGKTDVFPLRYLYFSRSASLCLLYQLLGLVRTTCKVFQTFTVYLVFKCSKINHRMPVFRPEL